MFVTLECEKCTDVSSETSPKYFTLEPRGKVEVVILLINNLFRLTHPIEYFGLKLKR